MKLISWNSNCNWNTRNGAWKLELLRREYPDSDAVFLMEYPNDIKFANYVGVIARNGIPGVYPTGKDTRGVGLFCPEETGSSFRLRSFLPLREPSELAFACGCEFDCDGRSFRMACVWNYPKIRNGKRGDYLKNALELIDCAGEFLAGHKSILLGDFNITAFHESGKNSMKEREALARCFASHDLCWLDAEKPEEEKKTWFMHKDLSKGYAIDFCAVTKSMIGADFKLEYGDPEKFVLRGKNGESASDHIPLILTIK